MRLWALSYVTSIKESYWDTFVEPSQKSRNLPLGTLERLSQSLNKSHQPQPASGTVTLLSIPNFYLLKSLLALDQLGQVKALNLPGSGSASLLPLPTLALPLHPTLRCRIQHKDAPQRDHSHFSYHWKLPEPVQLCLWQFLTLPRVSV